MVEDTVKKIEEKIRNSGSITGKKKAELLKLIASLQSEITNLAKAEGEHAESIAGFVERLTHEATRQKRNPELLRLSLAGLAASVKGFEASHPRMVEDINFISAVLANMGM